MSDQAATLRVIRGGDSSGPVAVSPRQRALAITGGKGGVGKSSLSVNLAVAYAQGGSRTLLVDADLGMADLNLLLGVAPEWSLLDALEGRPVLDILVEVHGISLLPALNGSYALANLGPTARNRAFAVIESLSDRFDTLIVDVAAGVGAVQTAFSAAADSVVVVTPEPLSLADAYACLKVLRQEQGVDRAYVLPNRVTSRDQADELTGRLGALVERFLDLELVPLPPVPFDPSLAIAAAAGVPLMLQCPDAPAARAIRQVTRALDAYVSPELRPGVARQFWLRMFETSAEGQTP